MARKGLERPKTPAKQRLNTAETSSVPQLETCPAITSLMHVVSSLRSMYSDCNRVPSVPGSKFYKNNRKNTHKHFVCVWGLDGSAIDREKHTAFGKTLRGDNWSHPDSHDGRKYDIYDNCYAIT